MNGEETTVFFLGGNKRPRGRPRVEEPRSTVSTWVWARHHDALIKLAQKREMSVSALVREILDQAVK